MGVYQEWAAEFHITEAALAAVKADPEFEAFAERAWYKAKDKSLADWTIEDLASLIAEYEGADSFGGEDLNVTPVTGGDGWVLAGSAYGKLPYDSQEFEGLLARCGVTGEIDFDCEGERGRTVLAHGKARITPGTVVYGDDFSRIMDALKKALHDEGLPQSGQDRIYNAVSEVVNSI